MKAVLMSIQPKWCELIAKGEKEIDLRKTAPALKTPFKCYIYCTKDELLTKSHYNGGLYVAHNKKSKSALERAGNITFSGKIIGEFVCDKIDIYKHHKGLTRFGGGLGLPTSTYDSYLIFEDDYEAMCLSYDEVKDYGKGETLCGWHISNLKIYDNPKGLGEFLSPSGSDGVWGNHYLYRPPQSWCYVEEL